MKVSLSHILNKLTVVSGITTCQYIKSKKKSRLLAQNQEPSQKRLSLLFRVFSLNIVRLNQI